MKFHNQFEKNKNYWAKLFRAQVLRYMMMIIIIIVLGRFCLHAAQIPPIVLPEKEFIVYDLKVENGSNEVTDGYTVYIDTAPTMPDIIVKLRPDYSLLTANMKYKITYNEHGRNDSKSYTATSINSWPVNYNGEFHGGEAVVTVSSGTITNTLTRSFHIRGKQPIKDDAVAGLSTEQRVVMYRENGYKHFLSSGLPDAQLNTNGTYDWGLMQINTVNNPTYMEIWSWQANKNKDWEFSRLNMQMDWIIREE